MIEHDSFIEIQKKELYLVYKTFYYSPPAKLAKKNYPMVWVNTHPYFFFTYEETYAVQDYTKNPNLNRDCYGIFDVLKSDKNYNFLENYSKYDKTSKIYCFKEDSPEFKAFNFSLEFLQKHMSGKDFRDWWYKPLIGFYH